MRKLSAVSVRQKYRQKAGCKNERDRRGKGRDPQEVERKSHTERSQERRYSSVLTA